MNYFDESQLDNIANNLVSQGYLILDDCLNFSLIQNLLICSNNLPNESFKAAGVGRQADFKIEKTIRTDRIHWIEGSVVATSELMQWMESLRVGINRRLFLGLFDYECHFARYAVGAFYKKHLDAFKGQGIRVLSTVLYLNEAWQVDEGGELVIYSEDGEKILEKILPVYGRLVIFLSKKFPHEVLPAKRERKSIAGWFRVNEGAM